MKQLRWLVISACVALATGAAQAELVVIASTAPGISAGKLLSNGEILSVPDGAMVMLLDQAGRSLTINGPYSDVAGGKDQAESGSKVMVAVASLLRSSDDYEEFGATRGITLSAPSGTATSAAIPENAIDVTRSTTFCVRAGLSPVLWRPDQNLGTDYKLSAHGDGTPLDFANNDALVAWPSNVPLEAGTYRITGAGRTSDAAMITLRIASGDAAISEPERIAWLAGQGCADQAKRHLASLRQNLAPLALFLDTDRGRKPTYKLGETMTLVAQTSRDAFLYCFYRDSSDQVITLFPSDYSKGAAVRGNEVLELPGERLPVTLEFTAPPGREQVQCFATGQDVSDQLPAEIVAGAFEVLPATISNRLDAIFGALSSEMLAVTSVELQIK